MCRDICVQSRHSPEREKLMCGAIGRRVAKSMVSSATSHRILTKGTAWFGSTNVCVCVCVCMCVYVCMCMCVCMCVCM